MEGLLVWFISFFLIIAIIGCVLYQVMCLADLEFDYINPYDSAARINGVVIPEFIIQGVLCLLFFLTGHWLMFMFSAPCLYFNMKLYSKKQHLVDVTEIFNMLNWEKRQRIIKLVYHIALLFVSLFWLVYNALEDD